MNLKSVNVASENHAEVILHIGKKGKIGQFYEEAAKEKIDRDSVENLSKNFCKIIKKTSSKIHYKNILVEIDDKDAWIPSNIIKVFKNFDFACFLGTAVITRKDNGLYADIEVNEVVSCMYPALGLIKKGNTKTIEVLSICESKNIDPLIPAIP